MPCYHPIPAFRRSDRFTESGAAVIVFRWKSWNPGQEIQVPCGQCIGCRLERSRQWAIRAVHEASLYSDNCFLTLTFSDSHLPSDGSLDKTVFQKFMKRLRKQFGAGIRYLMCGEYGVLAKAGDPLGRPHYHACVFNFDFSDKKYWGTSDAGSKLFRSADLEKLWTFGYSWIGELTFESAAYVARYSLKKVHGRRAVSHYRGRVPEYMSPSRRPGLGSKWFEKFKSDVFPRDRVVIRGGVQCKPPKYYDDQLFDLSPGEWDRMKADREEAAMDDPDSTRERLLVREAVKLSRTSLLRRDL